MRGLIAVMLLCTSAVQAAWSPTGDGFYLWTDLTGKSDGVLYQWYYDSYGNAYSKAVRNLSAQELVAINGPPPQQQQPSPEQYAYGQGSGNAPAPGWRTRALEVLAAEAAEQRESADFNKFMEKYRGSSYSQSGMSLSQYGLKSPAMFIGDLPAQQGNTVYGSLDPTYNSIAEPIRRFDWQAYSQSLLNLAQQYESGHLRVSSDTRQLLTEMTQALRVLDEHQIRYEGDLAILRELRERGVSGSQSLRIQGSSGVESAPPPKLGAPPSGGPPDAPPDGGMDKDYAAFADVVARRCLSCHGGPQTTEKSKGLIVGSGGKLDLSKLDERTAKRMFFRVDDGSMPEDAPLKPEELAVFDKMKEALFGGKK